MPLLTNVASVFGALSLGYLSWSIFWRLSNLQRLPPGPPKNLIFGNLLDIPKHNAWEKFQKDSCELGSDIICYQYFGKILVVLNSYQAAVDLFGKKSAVYSGRPRYVMMGELLGWNCSFSNFQEPDRLWQRHRKILHESFNASDIDWFQNKQTAAAELLVKMIRQSPQDFLEHISRAVSSMMLDITYGLDLSSDNDLYMDLVSEASASFRAAVDGGFLVDFFPILKYIPGWVPGSAGFQLKVKEWRCSRENMFDKPFEAAKDFLHDSLRTQNFFVSMGLHHDKANETDIQTVIRDIAGTIILGSVDTMTALLTNFFLAMMTHPEVQRRAQQEIDGVIACNGFPKFSDLNSMPYIQALVLELLRWRQVVPTGIPHSLLEDDRYKGFLIPKGTILVANAWAMSHDENDYNNPLEFKPERFLASKNRTEYERDPRTFVFGFGRRYCPGKYISQSTLAIFVATILTSFDIQPDESHPPLFEYKSSFLRQPKAFPCKIKARNF
ncbi:hypothetical protein GYMLUDRAFT_233260 [Collybiopsis luxurians FD-317 M1]|uniref:Cytochrome P450 n=1 Tax=Collybiopsis luxurians FD-317 M1 TaxID=944289 RepID=A0A0D0C4N4_9AGAR|nr:hypothetical protein GYMLUDRAFT_233260 [Collybiopsis luxurians FD-317 M1]